MMLLRTLIRPVFALSFLSPLFALVPAGRAAAAAEAVPPFTRVALLGDPSPGDIQPMTDSQGNLWRQVAVRLKQQAERVETLRPDPANWKVDSVTLSGKYLDSVLNSGAEACLVSIDTYDYDYDTGRSPEESAATVAAVCKKLADQGIVPILGGALPSGPGWMATRAPWVVRERELLAQVAAADPRILDLSWERTLDPDGDGVGDAQYYAGGMLKEEGVNQLGARVAEVLAAHVRPRDVMAGVQWLTPNAELRITPDRSPGNFVPSGWANYPAGTLSDYVYPRSPALGQWWQMKLPAVGRAEIFFEGITQELNQTLRPGERIEFVVEYETDADVSADFEVFAELAGVGNRGPLGRLAGGVAVSPPQEIHEETLTAEPRVLIIGSGTVRLGRMGVRKISPWAPGPYPDDLTALLKGGVKAGEVYTDAQGEIHTAGPATVRKLALWGDMLMDGASSYGWTAQIGTPLQGFLYRLRGQLADPQTYTVRQVKSADPNGRLAVAMDGHALTVTLGMRNGEIFSTVGQVLTQVQAAFPEVFERDGRGGIPVQSLAAEQGVTAFTPVAGTTGRNPFVWLQVLMKQRFELARRLQNSGTGGLAGFAGDWDFGTPGATAATLALNPGPLGDILSSDAEVIVGCAGMLDIVDGSSDPVVVAGNVLHLWDLLDAAGRHYVWMELPPAVDAGRQAVTRGVNAALREAAAERHVMLLAWPDQLTTPGAEAKPVYFPDGYYPSDTACLIQAQAMLQGPLQALIQPDAPDYGHTADTWLTANPQVTGSLNGLASYWINRTPEVLTTAKSTEPGMTADAQEVMVKRAVPDWQDGVLVARMSRAGWQAGDVVEGVAEISVPPGGLADVDSLTVTVLFDQGNSGRLTALKPQWEQVRDWPQQRGATGKDLLGGVIRTPACAIPAWVGDITLEIRCHGAGKFAIRNAGVRKAVYPIDPAGPVAPVDVRDLPAQKLVEQTFSPLAAGTYAGAISQGANLEISGAQPTGLAVGGFDSFILGKKGTFTARGTVLGTKFVVKGQFGAEGYAADIPVTLPGGAGAMLLRLYTAADGTVRIGGELVRSDHGSGTGRQEFYRLDLVRSGGATVAAAQAGYYTAVIPGLESTQQPAPAPEGHGLAMMTLQANGSLRCRYLLADGTVGTRSAKVSGGAAALLVPGSGGSALPVWEFYFPLAGAKGGSLAGEVVFRHVETPPLEGRPVTDVDGQVTFTRAADPRAALFPAGYAVQRDLLGVKYVAAAKGQLPLPDMRPVGPAGSGVDANAGLIVDDETPSPVAWLVKDRIVAPGVALKLDRKTGLISGTMVREGTKTKLAVHALAMPNYRLALGFYQGKGEVGSLLVSPDHFE